MTIPFFIYDCTLHFVHFAYHDTGKERDSESGLDYFGARYYGSNMGRFMSPDDGSAWDPTNPQTWNLYSYVLNNPLIFTDPTGRECVWDDGSFDSKDDPDTGSQAQCENSTNGGTWVDPTAFATLGAGDWSSQANAGIASVASTLSGSSASITVSADGSQSITTQGMNLDGMVQTQVTSEGYLPPPYSLYPQNMQVVFPDNVRHPSFTPWQQAKRWINCLWMGDPNGHVGPKAPEPTASSETVPNGAASLRSVHTSNKSGSTYGPQLGDPNAAEGMETLGAGMAAGAEANNCSGSN